MSIPIPRVSKTLDDVRSELFARIEEVQEEYQAKGWLPSRLNLNKGVIRGMLELFCWGLYQLYQLMAFLLVQGFPKHCTDAEWMELHADQVEEGLKQATKTQGQIVYTRTTATGNVRINAGQITRTRTDGSGQRYRFVTTEDAVLADVDNEVTVAIEAEEYGAASNVTTGQIVEQVTPIPGVEVSNASDWLISEGADKETVKQLSERYTFAWLGLDGTNKYAYMGWALGVKGVIAATVHDQHPRGQGTVDVVIKGAAGIPTTILLTEVRTVISENNRYNDDWQVVGPTSVPTNITAELVIYPGYDPTTIEAEAKQRIQALFTDPTIVEAVDPLQVGDDLTLDRLRGVIMAVKGVKSINWTTPVEDVVVSASGLATLGTLTVTSVEAAEE